MFDKSRVSAMPLKVILCTPLFKNKVTKVSGEVMNMFLLGHNVKCI